MAKLVVSNCQCGNQCVSGVKYESTGSFSCKHCDPSTYLMLAVYKSSPKQ